MDSNVLDVVSGWSVDSGPLYKRLAGAIQAAVERGDLPPGTILPAERHLAKSLAVGRSTVVGAYDLLRSSGVVISKQGSGTWIAGAERNAKSTRLHQESLRSAALSDSNGLIDLATASLPACAEVKQAIRSLGDAELDAVLNVSGYSSLGLPQLRAAVADMFQRDGLPTSSEQILITTGDQQALSLITQHYLRSGDAVVVEDPTSPGVLDLLRREPVVVRSSKSVASSGAAPLIELIKRSAPSLVYLLTSLGPEGLVTEESAVRMLGRSLRDFPGVVVEDTSSRMLIPGRAPTYLASLAPSSNVLTVGSMSKLFWGGLRVGWVRGDENVVLRLSKDKARADLGTPLLSQLVAAKLIARLDDVKGSRQTELAARSQFALALCENKLPDFSVTVPHGGVTLWAQLPRGASRPFVEVAQRHGVAVVAGDALSPGGANAAHIRVSLGASDEAFTEGIARLARAWSEFDGPSLAAATTDGVPLV